MDEEIQFSVITNFIVKEKWVKTGKKERHMNRSTYVYGLQFLLLIFRVCKLIPHPSKRGTLIKALIKKSPEAVHAEESLDLVKSGVRWSDYTAFVHLNHCHGSAKKSCQLPNISWPLHALWFLPVLVTVSQTAS